MVSHSKEQEMVNIGPAGVSVDAAQFVSRFKTKVEVWKFCRHECRAYIPAHECGKSVECLIIACSVTVYFLKGLINGELRFIKCE